MTKNGETIQDYLEIFQHKVSVGCTKNAHRYAQNGSACMICGKTKSD